MKKMQLFQNGKKRAATGVAICFIATIALTGAYTWRNYQDTQEELKKMEEAQIAENEEKEELEVVSGTAKKGEEKVEKKEEVIAETTNVADASDPMLLEFNDDSRLLWPINGTVIMNYSMDQSVYFATLDQYKYNPALIIAGAINDNVIASAPGVVKSIDTMRETGTTVTVDMGNGYECHYGQLKDVKVKVGDYVQTKDVIGYISEPTKYYSLEGANLYFEMRKDGQPVDPLNYMNEE